MYLPSRQRGLFRRLGFMCIDPDAAVKVGSRHGKPVVYEVAPGAMQKDGYVFFQLVNSVWLAKHVPVKYLKRI